MTRSKVLHTELKENISRRFEIIKSTLGIQNDAEVVQFLIQSYYQEHIEKHNISAIEEMERDKVIIKKFMDKYGDQWRKLGEN